MSVARGDTITSPSHLRTGKVPTTVVNIKYKMIITRASVFENPGGHIVFFNDVDYTYNYLGVPILLTSLLYFIIQISIILIRMEIVNSGY